MLDRLAADFKLCYDPFLMFFSFSTTAGKWFNKLWCLCLYPRYFYCHSECFHSPGGQRSVSSLLDTWFRVVLSSIRILDSVSFIIVMQNSINMNLWNKVLKKLEFVIEFMLGIIAKFFFSSFSTGNYMLT